MEENNQELNKIISQPEEKKNKVGMIVCIACLAVLAVAGLAFGTYAMATKDAAVAEAAASCGGNSSLPNQGEASESAPGDAPEANEITCPDGTTAEVEVPSIANPSEYIIIGEFGIKIKKPENWLRIIGKYTYYNDFPHAVPTFEITDIEGDYAYLSPIGTDCKNATFGYSACFKINDIYYTVSEMPNPSEMTEADGLTEVYRTFYNFVTNQNNYSKI